MAVILTTNAIIRRLQTMPGRPAIAYPNGPQVTELPRIVVEVPSPVQRASGVDGTTEGEAEVVARVETADGQFDGEASGIVTDIIQRFPPGLRLDHGTVIEAPSPRARYEASGVYHIPVIIRARYHF